MDTMIEVLAAMSIPLILLALLFFVISMQRRQKERAGNLLLRVPLPRSRRVAFLIIGAVLYVLGFIIVPLIHSRFSGIALNLFWDFVRGLLWGGGIAVAIYGVSSMELRDRGIWLSGLIEWSHIRSYRWQGSEGKQLVLDLRRKYSFSTTLKRTVPLNMRPTVEQVLQQKLLTSHSV